MGKMKVCMIISDPKKVLTQNFKNYSSQEFALSLMITTTIFIIYMKRILYTSIIRKKSIDNVSFLMK